MSEDRRNLYCWFSDRKRPNAYRPRFWRRNNALHRGCCRTMCCQEGLTGREGTTAAAAACFNHINKENLNIPQIFPLGTWTFRVKYTCEGLGAALHRLSLPFSLPLCLARPQALLHVSTNRRGCAQISVIYGRGHGYILEVMITFMSAMLLSPTPTPFSTQGCCRLLMSLSVYHYLWMKRRRKRRDGDSDRYERKVWMLLLHPLNYISSKIGRVGDSACHRRRWVEVSSQLS